MLASRVGLAPRPAWRRQSRLPPTATPDLPANLWVVYDARLALARLWQLYRIFVQAPDLPGGYRWRAMPMPTPVRLLAEDCGLILADDASHATTTCPHCHHGAYVLHASMEGWRCCRCDPLAWTRLEQELACYGIGLVVGLSGRPMVRRRARIIRQTAALAGRVKTVRELAAIGTAGALLAYSPHWPRRHPRKGESRSIPRRNPRLGMMYVEACIDSMLHPTAYLARRREQTPTPGYRSPRRPRTADAQRRGPNW